MRYNTTLPETLLLCANGRESEFIAYLNNNNYAWREVAGMYNGIPERSFVVVLERSSDLSNLLSQGQRFKQDSVLHLDSQRKATLIYSNGSKVFLGVFRAVSKAIAEQNTAYTYDSSSQTYFIAA